MTQARPTELSGAQKAAILLAVVGEEAAAAILNQLNEKEIGQVTQELSILERVPSETTEQVLKECCEMALTQDYNAAAGPEYTKRLLVKAFGQDGANTKLKNISQANESMAARIQALQQADPQQLARFLEAEHPQTVALVLGHLDAKQASALLMRLPEPIRAEAVKRLANLRQCSPEMPEKVSLILNRRLQALGGSSRRSYEGFKSVAELMNRLDSTSVQQLLEHIEQNDPELAINIRNQMFTFEDFVEVPEQQLRELMTAVDKKTLTLALKGASETVRSHFCRTMSSRAVEMLKDDMEALGPVRGRDVTKAQQEVVATARKLEAEGKLALRSDGDDEYVV